MGRRSSSYGTGVAIFAAMAALVLASSSSGPEVHDWPQFRGPNRDGVSPSAKPPLKWSDSENVRWKISLPGPGSSSPIVVGGRVYVSCYSGYGAHLDNNGDRAALKHHILCFSVEVFGHHGNFEILGVLLDQFRGNTAGYFKGRSNAPSFHAFRQHIAFGERVQISADVILD